jgi:N-acetylneuraminic acid mutarotase
MVESSKLMKGDQPMLRALKNLVAPLLIVGLIACSSVGDTHKASVDEGVVAPAAGMKTARSGHTATSLPNGNVLIAGGMTGNGNYYDTVEIYSPATKIFRPARSMSARREGHTTTLLPDGKVLIAGGYDGDYLASAEVYDPATDSFTTTGRMTVARSEHIAVLLNNGKVMLAGGVGTGWTFLASAELYNPSNGTFTPTGSMTTPRESHTVTLLKSGKVLITGGHKDRREAMTVYSSAELYDPARGVFSATGSMTTIRHKHAAALLPDGNVLIVGGSDKRDWQGKYASAEIYDSIKGMFKAAGDMNMARFKLASAVVSLRNGKILIGGGAERLELYDPVTNSFSMIKGKMDRPRYFSAATLLQDGRVLITGGYDDHNEAGAQTWIYET